MRMMDGAQSGTASIGEPYDELSPVPVIARPADKPCSLEPRQGLAQRLALDVDGSGQLFLIEGSGGEPLHGNGGRPRQAQRCQDLIVAALDETGGLAQEPVTIPKIAPGFGRHHKQFFPVECLARHVS